MREKILYLSLFLSILLASTVITALSAKEQDNAVMEAWLVAKAYDSNGNLLWKIEKKDPLTLNFGRWLSLFLCPGSCSINPTDTGGTARTVTRGSAAAGVSPLGPYDLKIVVGTGTTAFSVNNYALASQVQSATASAPTISIIGNKANVSISASFTFSSATTITEIGYIIYEDQYNYAYSYLFAREVLGTAKAVPAGGQLTVTWILRINQG